MQNSPRLPLPVAVDSHDEESGLSYVMRSLHANGLTLEVTRSWLDIKSWYSLDRQELTRLAWLIGVTPDWLRWRSLRAKRSANFTTFDLLGCKFVSASIRHSKIAVICPECVRSKGFCRATWLLKLIVVCPEHGTAMLERCGKCGQLISWQRPDVDVCDCRRYLVYSGERGCVTDQLVSWVRWIEWRIGSYSGPETGSFAKHIPQNLNEMSLDGAMRLVMSFGLLEDSTQAVRVAAWKTLRNPGVIGVIERGLSRLRQLDGTLALLGEVGPLVHVPILERMRSDGVDSSDILNATYLVSALKKKPYGTWDRRVKLPHGQLSLFG